MTGPLDLFGQINNAVLDLQSANCQSFERPIKALGRLLQHADLAETNAHLAEGLDLASFLTESIATRSSMVGSARLIWPDSPEQVMGLTLLLIERFARDPKFMADFGHTYFYSGRKIIDDIHAVTAQLIIPFVRDYRAYIMAKGNTQTKLVMPLSKKVFIVHGHDEGARESVARLLATLGLDPIILHEQANRGMTVIEKVEANSEIGFAVVLLTPDDEGCAKGGSPEPRARQNVLLELGYFIGRLGRDKVCTLMRGHVEIPSDFAGVLWETMDNGNGWKFALGRELRAAGHQIDLNKIMP